MAVLSSKPQSRYPFRFWNRTYRPRLEKLQHFIQSFLVPEFIKNKNIAQ
jgi:hypothetical protein